MAVIDTHPEPIQGPWTEGFVLDRHVIRSVPIGYLGQHMQFDTRRSALGELVYQLKNRRGSPDEIIETAADFVAKRWVGSIDCLIWPPPSIARRRQPAAALAEGIGGSLALPAFDNVVIKTQPTPQMKNVPVHERKALISAAIHVGTTPVAGMSVLIVDDLWQTGATICRVAEVVGAMGATQVRALVMTRTK